MTPTVPAAPEVEPLTRWGRAWRVLACLLATTVLLLMTFAEMDAVGALDDDRYTALLLADLLLAPVLPVALWWHRRFPLWLSLAITLLSGVSTAAIAPAGLLLLSVCTRRRWREIAAMVAATILACFVSERVWPTQPTMPWWLGAILYGAFTAAVVAWGLYIGARRELVAQWRWRAQTAEAEQARQVAAAAQGERARIAREMHDVLAHRLSQVSLHAGVLSYRTDLTPEQVRAQAETVRAGATAALEDLRSVLGVLRNDDGDALAAPQPTLADLPALLAGDDLDDRTTGPVPPSLGRHAYRMVQEGLTNARRHAPGSPVSVHLSGRPGADLVVRVANGPGGPTAGGGAGLGLVGVRERAAVLGGTASAGPTAGGGWLLEARLPWPATKEDA